MRKRINTSRDQGGLTWGQKAAAAGLVVLAVVIVIGWMVNLNYNLRNSGPTVSMEEGDTSESDEDSLCMGDDCYEEEELRNTDTDGDGLSDWEELNVYDTSPYLEDTDGDGIPDGEEVEKGTDPNCPEGKDCDDSQSLKNEEGEMVDNSSAANNSSSSVATSEGEMVDNSSAANNSSSSVATSSELSLNSTSSQDKEKIEKVLQGEGDPDVLRDMLLEAGMDEEILNQVDDDELMENYKETLQN